MTALAARGLRFRYGDHAVLDGVDIALEPGTLTLLAGRNGAGKSTLLALLAGILRPHDGEVRVATRRIDELGSMERARTITLVPQGADVSFEYTGREIVLMGRHPHIRRLGTASAADHAAVDAALAITDSAWFADRSVRTLSGGELRRIHIAQALATQAPILLLDEPTVNLDLEHAVAILALLRDLAGKGHCVLISSHDLNLIAPRCDRLALLHERRILRAGPPPEVLDAATVETVFGVASRAPTGFFPREFDALAGS